MASSELSFSVAPGLLMNKICLTLVLLLHPLSLAAEPISAASSILPVDVAEAVASAAGEGRGALCKSRDVSDAALATPPILSISGLNSRQDNVDAVEGARQLEQFSEAFSAYAVLALATDDKALRERLIHKLAEWARAGALLGSRSCVNNGVLNTKGKCSEWKDPDGRDLSGMKDATFTTFIGAGLVRSYYVALADFGREHLVEEHAAIETWITQWSTRLKRPGPVYFGLNMGWYWPSITNELAQGNKSRAIKQLKALESGLIKLINKDGSIVDRTTRGDRALWYHYTSIGEAVVSMELMRAAGMKPSSKLEDRLHAAVELFIRAVEDHSVLDRWAKVKRNSRYNGSQDWSSGWPNNNFAGTWLHIYPYRYPDNPNAASLRRMVKMTSRSAVADIDLGIGLGCLYNIASTAR